MLGWMLRGSENADSQGASTDATNAELPDTPAPVFAARALKSALFGTPAIPDDSPLTKKEARESRRAMAGTDKGSSGTPSKPPGILLTPGTGTSRRKRVSFGHHVGDTEPTTGKPPTEATSPSKGVDDSEADWEEEDDDDGFCTHDVTLDLNEPHSQSGRYWKGQFERYHQEAKAEMEKLLKYKQLAKSYARQKDAEAVRLAERLREERQRVIHMEKKIADNASKIVSRRDHSDDREPGELLAKLTKQTSLAAEYRQRVHELESELDDVMRQKDQQQGAEAGSRRRRVVTAASPTTQKTLVETQRELRRARVQLRELDALRQEMSALKRTQTKTTSLRDKKDQSSLKLQLDQSREETRKRSEELDQLKSDFEAFRRASEAYEADSRAVLERAQGKVSDLKREMRALKASRRPSPDDNRRRKNTRDSIEGALTERTNAEKPTTKWQPFIARSPRARASRSSQDSAAADDAREGAAQLPADSKQRGGGGGALPPERRAAALARIESRMEERRRVTRTHDKENRRPQSHAGAWLGVVCGVTGIFFNPPPNQHPPPLQTVCLSVFLSLSPEAMAASDGDDANEDDLKTLQAEVTNLEAQLASAPEADTTHSLLLLADSALPIGCFAFSSGLESFLAHGSQPDSNLRPFLGLTLSSTASTSLPFFLAAHGDPEKLLSLDDELDASILCPVARRASLAQGRALLAVWDRSLGHHMSFGGAGSLCALRQFAALLRAAAAAAAASTADDDDDHVPPQPSAHLAPLFGAVCAVAGLAGRQAAYVFLLGHARAVVSAAVRAGVVGPYQAQRVLAADQLRRFIDALIEREWQTPVECAGQSVPVMDLWIGRHELLYSRIFNS
ncbi:hypothetical protein L249_2008 [Ophiocordyceps polyrhachis-furcata BCC 54312]|uniref:Spindle pole body-associated protein cut12 domain-containing protein n=1 Tax=Ophiocordyceps polyrhachis-furcata BCC 54312 TaxID=1330021 RepID=A0A367LQA4_9HYPO|nr:hypothetical protein L249_2008 [Ophiocordyceps polyrhachis-furcata BCC 54312]